VQRITTGNYSMDVVVASTDPVNPVVTVPVSMTISAIPVELTAFVANTDRNNVSLKWSTARKLTTQVFR